MARLCPKCKIPMKESDRTEVMFLSTSIIRSYVCTKCGYSPRGKIVKYSGLTGLRDYDSRNKS